MSGSLAEHTSAFLGRAMPVMMCLTPVSVKGLEPGIEGTQTSLVLTCPLASTSTDASWFIPCSARLSHTNANKRAVKSSTHSTVASLSGKPPCLRFVT